MGLFDGSVTQDTIYCAEYLKVLSCSGMGIESIVVKASKLDFGNHSMFFREIVRGDMPIRESLEMNRDHGRHPYIKQVVNAILSGKSEDYDLIIEIALEDKKKQMMSLTRVIDVTTSWLVILPLIPLFLLLSDYLADMMSEFPEDAFFGLSFDISWEVQSAVLVAGCAVVVMIISIIRVRSWRS